jgi:monoterpene epsilon-lactone hydrolase
MPHKQETLRQNVIKTALRTSFKLMSAFPIPLQVLRATLDLSGPLVFRPRPDVQIEKISLGGVDAEKISAKKRVKATSDASKKNGNSKIALLHFHGGAFFAGSANTHRAMCSELAARSGASVYLLNYRLAPDYPYPAALDDGLAAYEALLAYGYSAHQIVLAGDSGGAAHVIALCVLLRERGMALPRSLVLLSPFVDLTLGAESVVLNKKRDPMLRKKALVRGGNAYRGKLATSDPRISPLYADLQGLPPMLIQVGSEEILLDDARHLAQRARDAGVRVEYHLYAGMWHNFQMFSMLHTAQKALNQIAWFVTE